MGFSDFVGAGAVSHTLRGAQLLAGAELSDGLPGASSFLGPCRCWAWSWGWWVQTFWRGFVGWFVRLISMGVDHGIVGL